MILLPNDIGRRGPRTTEFWLASVGAFALLVGAFLTEGIASATMSIGAALLLSVYIICRSAFKIRAAKDSQVAMQKQE